MFFGDLLGSGKIDFLSWIIGVLLACFFFFMLGAVVPPITQLLLSVLESISTFIFGSGSIPSIDLRFYQAKSGISSFHSGLYLAVIVAVQEAILAVIYLSAYSRARPFRGGKKSSHEDIFNKMR